MISFKQFITEEQEFDLRKFESDCKPFFDSIKGLSFDINNSLPFHGTISPPNSFTILKNKFFRPSRSFTSEVHDLVNDFFENKFGWRAREDGIFTYGDIRLAKNYSVGHHGIKGNVGGSVTVIIPIGKFKSLYSPDAGDLYDTYANTEQAVFAKFDDEIPDDAEDQVNDRFSEALYNKKWVLNDPKSALEKKKVELILGSDKYYQFNVNNSLFTETVFPYLKENI